MSKHQILEFTSITGHAIFLDATRIESVVALDDPTRCQVVTSSDTYHVQLDAKEAASRWKDAL